MSYGISAVGQAVSIDAAGGANLTNEIACTQFSRILCNVDVVIINVIQLLPQLHKPIRVKSRCSLIV